MQLKSTIFIIIGILILIIGVTLLISYNNLMKTQEDTFNYIISPLEQLSSSVEQISTLGYFEFSIDPDVYMSTGFEKLGNWLSDLLGFRGKLASGIGSIFAGLSLIAFGWSSRDGHEFIKNTVDFFFT